MQGNLAADNTARGGGKRTRLEVIGGKTTRQQKDKNGRRITQVVDGCWQQRHVMEHIIGSGEDRGVQWQCVGSSAVAGCGR
jgi:hypothetical protein